MFFYSCKILTCNLIWVVNVLHPNSYSSHRRRQPRYTIAEVLPWNQTTLGLHSGLPGMRSALQDRYCIDWYHSWFVTYDYLEGGQNRIDLIRLFQQINHSSYIKQSSSIGTVSLISYSYYNYRYWCAAYFLRNFITAHGRALSVKGEVHNPRFWLVISLSLFPFQARWLRVRWSFFISSVHFSRSEIERLSVTCGANPPKADKLSILDFWNLNITVLISDSKLSRSFQFNSLNSILTKSKT